MTDPVVFIDTETTSLDPATGEVWDVALIEADGTEHVYHLAPQHLETAEPGALRVNRYYERIEPIKWAWSSRRHAAEEIARLTLNKHLVGIVPSFDAGFLGAFLRENGQQEAWRYDFIDVEVLAAGFARGRQRASSHERPAWLTLPIKTDRLCEYLGIDLTDPRFEKHTAIGDARLAKAIWDKVMGE